MVFFGFFVCFYVKLFYNLYQQYWQIWERFLHYSFLPRAASVRTYPLLYCGVLWGHIGFLGAYDISSCYKLGIWKCTLQSISQQLKAKRYSSNNCNPSSLFTPVAKVNAYLKSRNFTTIHGLESLCRHNVGMSPLCWLITLAAGALLYFNCLMVFHHKRGDVSSSNKLT